MSVDGLFTEESSNPQLADWVTDRLVKNFKSTLINMILKLVTVDIYARGSNSPTEEKVYSFPLDSLSSTSIHTTTPTKLTLATDSQPDIGRTCIILSNTLQSRVDGLPGVSQ